MRYLIVILIALIISACHDESVHPCDDGDLCTHDYFDADGNCIYEQIACPPDDSCHVWFCVAGECRQNNLCIVDTIPCDDGDACTDDYRDDNGNCIYEQINCDDNDPCTDDTCVGGVCLNLTVNCDDEDPCTKDSCNQGNCVNTDTCG